MKCPNCGTEIPDGAKFCTECGAPVSVNITKTKNSGPDEAEKKVMKGVQVTPGVYHCPDGKFRWIYEYDMVKNPVILFTVFNVLAIAALIIFAFTAILALAEGDLHSFKDLWDRSWPVFAILGVLLVIAIPSYLIVARSYGWRYMVLFEMDDAGVNHIQMPSQFKKAEALGWLSAMAGILAGSAGLSGAGILAASRSSLYSDFSKVKKIKVRKAFHTIKLNQHLVHNQVYAANEDFDFILNYIREHVRL